MKIKSVVVGVLLNVSIVLPTFTSAAVSQQEAKKLGRELTPMGADKNGNMAGTIPAWTGRLSTVPQGLSYMGSGDAYPDPYAEDKVLFTITAQNLPQHQDKLSTGQIALLKKYPQTYNIPVYPSHRDGRFAQLTESRTAWNAVNTVLVNGIDGLQYFTGGAPFPLPKNGAEVMWNARVIHPHPTLVGVLDDVAVYLNGDRQLRKQRLIVEFPYAYPQNKIGDTEAQIGKNAGLVHVNVLEPMRSNGLQTIIQEALDQVKNERQVWLYIPGSRRVRRAPTVGYDTPDGPGGLVSVDDALGFNGAMDRYNWTLLGKKEVYIPYHNYQFDSPSVDYQTLLMPGHANPAYAWSCKPCLYTQ
ncbi:MAG: DUF1329 domain-containing protein [Pseudomonadales bacterium]|nr:DUF1329 domain-containing protein [Pseudomonadales bacterium]